MIRILFAATFLYLCTTFTFIFKKSTRSLIDNNPDNKFVRDYTLIALCTLDLHRICISLQVWEKVYSNGKNRDFKGAELESHSDKARPSDI